MIYVRLNVLILSYIVSISKHRRLCLCSTCKFLDVYLMSQKLLKNKLCFIESRKNVKNYAYAVLSFILLKREREQGGGQFDCLRSTQLKIDKLFMPQRPHAR